MFESDDVDREMAASGICTDLAAIAPKWNAVVKEVLTRATLSIPDEPPAMTGGRMGRHTEALGHMLSEMQIVARSHPGATW
jgi:ring-1,2-phenylacetyl-CoA epoxidase subunit PaaC